MSGDEVLVTVVATAIGLGGWLWRVVRLVRARRLRPGNGAAALGVVVACCAALVFFLLRTGASEDVQNAPEYLFMYVALGLAWIWAAESVFSLFGISARDDVIERRNGAASSPCAARSWASPCGMPAATSETVPGGGS